MKIGVEESHFENQRCRYGWSLHILQAAQPYSFPLHIVQTFINKGILSSIKRKHNY